MKRKDFFKRLFGIAAVVVITPKVLAEKKLDECICGGDCQNIIAEQMDGYTVKRTLYPVGIKDPAKQGGLIAGYDMVPRDGRMILIRNREFGKTEGCDGIDLTFVYHPDWDGPIKRYESNPDWEVIYKIK